MKNGDTLLIFNNKDGEYLAELKNKELLLLNQTRKYKTLPKKALAFSLIRQSRLSFMIEKVTELGVTHLFPLIFEYTQYNKFNKERYQKIIIEACEQSGRVDLPKLFDLTKLSEFLNNLPKNFNWYFGDINGDKEKLIHPLGIIIGPEGGFSKNEKEILKTKADSCKMSDTILRSETACICAMCQIRAIEYK